MVLLAALLPVTSCQTITRGGQIRGGAEIKACINAGPNGDIRLTTASAPCGLIYEAGFVGYALSQNPALATNHGASLTEACAGDAVRLDDLGRD